MYARVILPPLALLLVACAHVAPQGAARLAAFSPLDADPADLAVALRLPAGVAIRPGGAMLHVEVRRSDTGDGVEGSFQLMRTDAGDITVYRVAPVDLTRLRGVVGQARRWEAEDRDATQGALSISITGCATGGGPAADARVSVLASTAPDAEFFPLLRDAPLAKILERGEIGTLPPC